jgi:large subunit ribosomal protein L10
MNRDQKSAVIDEIAASITDSHAIFAVDYRGISVEQAKELRARLRESDATLRVVKNSLTERAADKVGAEQLKALLAGPTALTFVRGDGAAAAKSLADFARTTQLLAFKGGVMDGASLSPAEITAISRLPSREALYGQLVGLVANPITSLARTLNALIGGLAIGLSGVLEQRQAAGETLSERPEPSAAEPQVETPATDPPAEAPSEAPTDESEPEPTAEAATAPPAEESPDAAGSEPATPGASSEASEPDDRPSEDAQAGGSQTDTE